jgi:hypothetical protein
MTEILYPAASLPKTEPEIKNAREYNLKFFSDLIKP